MKEKIPTSLTAAAQLYTDLTDGAEPPTGFDKWSV